MSTNSALIWGVNGHPSYSSLTLSQQLAVVHNLGLSSYRVDVYDAGPNTISYLRNLAAAAKPLGISILPVLNPSAAACTSNSTAYQWGYNTAVTLGAAMPGLTWELGNELDEFAIKPAATGGSQADYDATKMGIVSSVIGGMSTGLKQADPNARTIVDITGIHFGFLQKLSAMSVTWDITGEHYYAAPNSTDLLSGAQGLFSQLASFGRPIELTEFNQQGGSQLSLQSEADTLVGLMTAVASVATQYGVTAAYVYELLDEPNVTAAEGGYGLATSAGALKPAGLSVQTYLRTHVANQIKATIPPTAASAPASAPESIGVAGIESLHASPQGSVSRDVSRTDPNPMALTEINTATIRSAGPVGTSWQIVGRANVPGAAKEGSLWAILTSGSAVSGLGSLCVKLSTELPSLVPGLGATQAAPVQAPQASVSGHAASHMPDVRGIGPIIFHSP